MSQIDFTTLNQNFGIAGHLEFVPDVSGLAIAHIANSHAQAAIALQGAHIMRFQANDEQPLIWLSPVAKLVQGKSIRGGVPICWPWFGAHASDATFPGHGFARTVAWHVAASEALPDGSTRIEFELPQSSIPAAQWPHPCRCRLVATVGKVLTVELITENTGETAFDSGEALHTYFAISDVDQISISGMEDCTYLDKVGVAETRTQQGTIQISSEVDRIYIDTAADCLIEDRGLKRRIRIAKSGSQSNVVWNPWVEKSAKMGDFGSNTGYRGMVCVESANAASNIVTVSPGSTHCLRVVYSTENI
ncbi:MAG: D-hexose-6-phosphate mutarotase [Gallionellaceae bacterium]